jgi:hypothetical protein
MIVDLLKTIKDSHNDARVVKNIDYAIEKIGQKNIYDVDIVHSLDLATTKKQSEVTSGWLREFSSIHMEEVRNNYLQNMTI